jgi:hypothetical protein
VKPYDWHLGLRMRRLLGRRLRIDRRQAFEVTSESRLILREVLPIAHSLAPRIPGWPKVIPVSTIQRRSEYRWISDTPVIVTTRSTSTRLATLQVLVPQRTPDFLIRGAPYPRGRVQH